MGILDYKYLGEITKLYTYLTNQYPSNTVYFSEYLEIPSCCIEDDNNKWEFHIKENSMQNNEVWLFNNKDSKKAYSGMGYGEKLKDVIKQVESFLKESGFKAPVKQLTIFDFI